MSVENKRVIQRFLDEVMNGGNLSAIDTLFSPDYIPHDPSNPDRQGGIDGAKQFIRMFHTGLTNQEYIVEDMIAEGDRVAYRWTIVGIHTGNMMGIPASGKELNFSGMDMFRLENGKIVESWVIADALTMLQQLGVL
jgi:steroid delta-isomerase-like uncharacterized protein